MVGVMGERGSGLMRETQLVSFLPHSISVIVIFVVMVYLIVLVSKTRILYKDDSKLDRVSNSNNKQDKHLEGVLVLKTKVVELQRTKSQDLSTWTLTMTMVIILTIVMLWKLLCWQFCIVFVVVDDQDLAHAPGVWHQEGCIGRALARFLLEPAKDIGLTDISDIFRILYNIFGQQILPVDGRKGRPLSPKNKRNHQLWCLQSWISLINQIKSLPSAWRWLETRPGSSSHWWCPSHRIWRRRPQNTHHCWN